MSAPQAKMLDGFPVLDIDPFSMEYLTNPYPTHERLRDTAPFVYIPKYGVWATGRYEEATAILKDYNTFISSGGVGLTNYKKQKPWKPPSLLLDADPPMHTHFRSVLSRALSPVALRSLRAGFEEVARRQVERLLDIGEFDAIAELAAGYPLKVFGDAVGVPAEGREKMLAYGNMSFNALGPQNEVFHNSVKDSEPVVEWVMNSCRRESLRPDGLGMVMYEAADRAEVSEGEALMLVRSFLSAGVDTTVRAVGSALFCFSNNPDQWEILRTDPSKSRAAFEEILRLESPFQTVFRTTSREADLAGLSMPAGEKIMLSLGSANRDPRKWEEPTRFNIARRTTGHVGFGAGIHGCVGQMIARLEVEVLLTALAERVSRIEVIGETELDINNTTRGFARLPIRIKA